MQRNKELKEGVQYGKWNKNGKIVMFKGRKGTEEDILAERWL